MTSTRVDLTFKHNLQQGRHGWLRLTPAYSVKVVQKILDENPEVNYIVDPFSGTGTTGLVCGERGLKCDLLDINPFLVWLGKVKLYKYSAENLLELEEYLNTIVTKVKENKHTDLWIPPISNIDRWWDEVRRDSLARLYQAISDTAIASSPVKDLLLVAFCQSLIQGSNVAFNHQSLSFKKATFSGFENGSNETIVNFLNNARTIIKTTGFQVIKGSVNITEADSRYIPKPENELYDCAITSPPYPNRMSYIRELRPYMYWLKYLKSARDAGELDWKAIGGTWGIATSLVGKWKPDGKMTVPYPGFTGIIQAIAERSQILSNYVHKYFADINLHLNSLFPSLAPGGKVFYIVGNSKFYDTLVPVEKIYAGLFEKAGFENVKIVCLRKRNSKKELYEFIVSGEKP